MNSLQIGSIPSSKVRRSSRRSRSSSIDSCLPHQPLFAARRKQYRRCSGNVFNHSIVTPHSCSSTHSEKDEWKTEVLPLTLKDLLPQGCDSSCTARIITVIVMTLMGFLVIFPIAPRLLAALAV
ncbi:hypothetical protein PRIPAC_79036 [Pristionchus pacificus]|uniref:Uncharacterized protein n=1 Tax=Pristionchus pacificus TaxID=54126 RepID=A0A2A6BHW6_PRIPA|nr:hypothetical protein PRIPAC_79036 [Pristionchus pacificus]|eukprot:PDM65438.1 hypothetical protein PRIPAC_52380 [Pristionchus pacificus]